MTHEKYLEHCASLDTDADQFDGITTLWNPPKVVPEVSEIDNNTQGLKLSTINFLTIRSELLDVCCGRGCVTHYINKTFPNAKCYGVDIGADYFISQGYWTETPNKKFYKASFQNIISNMNMLTDKFDFIITRNCYNTMTDTKVMKIWPLWKTWMNKNGRWHINSHPEEMSKLPNDKREWVTHPMGVS